MLHLSHHQFIPIRKAKPTNARCIQVITKKFVNCLHNCYKFKKQDYWNLWEKIVKDLELPDVPLD